MGRIKNMKIAKLFSLGLISCLLLNGNVAKADTISLTNGTVIENVTLNTVNDINRVDNIGISLSVKGTIAIIEEGYITIKDASGEAKIYLDGITIEGLKVDDYIFVTGIVNLQDSINVIVVNDASNIGVVNIDVTETPSDSEENGGEEDTENPDGSEEPENPGASDGTENPDTSNGTEVPGQEGENNLETNQPENNSGGNISGGNGAGNATSGSGNVSGGSSSGTQSGGTSTNITTTVSSKATIKGKTATTISYDLSSSQWASIQSAYEDGYIKLQDLPNNQIRIIKVVEEKGDTVWIVNDPRLLDEEEDSVFTVGTKLIEQIDYTIYDVTESKWQGIVEDVENGDAKIKVLDDDSIKVIYNKTEGADSTTLISKN